MSDNPTVRLTDYLVQAIGRAAAVFSTRPPADPQHALALGEAVALFNLADEFALVGVVRRTVDADLGYDVYTRLSEAMKRYYLGPAPRSAAGSAGRPASPHRPPPTPEARQRERRPRPSS